MAKVKALKGIAAERAAQIAEVRKLVAREKAEENRKIRPLVEKLQPLIRARFWERFPGQSVVWTDGPRKGERVLHFPGHTASFRPGKPVDLKGPAAWSLSGLLLRGMAEQAARSFRHQIETLVACDLMDLLEGEHLEVFSKLHTSRLAEDGTRLWELPSEHGEFSPDFLQGRAYGLTEMERLVEDLRVRLTMFFVNKGAFGTNVDKLARILGAELFRGLDREVVKRASQLRGGRFECSLEDYNRAIQHREMLFQVHADAPRLLPIFGMVFNRLKAADKKAWAKEPMKAMPRAWEVLQGLGLTKAGRRVLVRCSPIEVSAFLAFAKEAGQPEGRLPALVRALNFCAARQLPLAPAFIKAYSLCGIGDHLTPEGQACAETVCRASVPALRAARKRGKNHVHDVYADLQQATDFAKSHALGARLAVEQAPHGIPKGVSLQWLLTKHEDWVQAGFADMDRRREEILAQCDKGWSSRLETFELGDLKALHLGCQGALMEEGKAMHHCVGNYALMCIQDGYRIYSIRGQDGRRLATLSLRDHEGSVRMEQLYGHCNLPTPDKALWQRIRAFARKLVKVYQGVKPVTEPSAA